MAAFIGWTLGVWWFADTHGFNRCKVATQDIAIDAAVEARKQEREKQGKVNDTLQTQADEMATINARLVNDIKRLHQRESRRHLPETTEARCKGVTGASLSSPDAEFLVREAARADRTRTALKTCYGYADTVSR